MNANIPPIRRTISIGSNISDVAEAGTPRQGHVCERPEQWGVDKYTPAQGPTPAQQAARLSLAKHLGMPVCDLEWLSRKPEQRKAPTDPAVLRELAMHEQARRFLLRDQRPGSMGAKFSQVGQLADRLEDTKIG